MAQSEDATKFCIGGILFPCFWGSMGKIGHGRSWGRGHILTGPLTNSDHPSLSITGVRNCLGEPLARTEVFIIFTTLVQRFKFTKVQGQELDFTPILGLTQSPKKQEMVFTIR